MTWLERHFEVREVAVPGARPLFTKPGVRGYPGPVPGLGALLERVDSRGEAMIDATGSAGGFALGVGWKGPVWVYEPSRGAALCAEGLLGAVQVEVRTGAIWNAPQGGADLVVLLPQADRGSARVTAEFEGAFRALRPGGHVVFAIHRDLGARRYERWAERWFDTEVVGRSSGWRVVEGRRRSLSSVTEPAWLTFEVAGLELCARPGVFAAGRLDSGSEHLLSALRGVDFAGRRVLDLGCGYGILALEAARRGAVVTALDDDWPSVESSRRNLERHGLDAVVLHSDLTSDLGPGDTFDLVLTNPPFHVGKQVRLELPSAFVEAAHTRLRRGGELFLVANRALPYGALFGHFSRVDTVIDEGGFRVYRARK